MAWEEVDITPSAQRNEVTAVFLLRNTSGKNTTLEVGFPDYVSNPLQDFVVQIDGQKVEARLKKEVRDFPRAANPRNTIDVQWMVWPMTFRAHGEHKVKVGYYVPPRHVAHWTRTEAHGDQLDVFEEELVNTERTSLPDEVKRRIGAYESGYVLRTGAGWHGNIGKAVLRLHYSDEVTKARLNFLGRSSWAYDEQTNTATLTLVDFKPTEQSDVSYVFQVCPAAEQTRLLIEGLRRKQLDDPHVRLLVLKMAQADIARTLLPAEQARARLEETMQYVLPLAGPPVDAAKLKIPEREHFKEVFKTLWARYQGRNEQDKLAALAREYSKFCGDLVTMLDAEAAAAQDAGYKNACLKDKAQWAAEKKTADDVLGLREEKKE